MVLVVRGQVPVYLQNGDFFASLSGEDDTSSEIEIPDGVMKPDINVRNVADLAYLLKSLRFWLVATIPHSIFDFIEDHFSRCEDLCTEFERDFPVLTILQSVHTTPKADKMSVAVQSGRMEIIMWLGKRGCATLSKHLGEAALAGHLHVLTFLHGRHKIPSTTAQNAAQGGHQACLKYSLENGCPLNKQLMVPAAEAGSVACLRYLVEKGCTLNVHVAQTAAKAGSLECLQFTYEQKCPWGSAVSGAAARNGHLQCLQYVHEHGCPLGKSVAEDASVKGPAGCLEYLLKYGCKVTTATLKSTLFRGSASCVKLLIAAKVRLNAELCAEAARYGHIECLQLLHEAHCPWDASTCVNAAIGDTYYTSCKDKKLQCLLYAHEHGCPWNAEAPRAAAAAGYLQELQYMHEHGCPWDTYTCSGAAGNGELECLRYAHEHGCPWEEHTCSNAAQYGQRGCLRYAHEHGCPWDEGTIEHGCHGGRWACVQYAYEHGCRWDAKACTQAVKSASYWWNARDPPPPAELLRALGIQIDHAALQTESPAVAATFTAPPTVTALGAETGSAAFQPAAPGDAGLSCVVS